MKRPFYILIILVTLSVLFTSTVSAQGMMNWGSSSSTTSSEVSSTAQDEAKGKQIWENLQSKQITCSNITNDDFEVLGEYFMGQAIGNTERHAAMNQMMINMMGQNGEEQMHIALGKRASGCNTAASFLSGNGFPMMGWMMGGGGNPMMGYGGWGSMMNGWDGFGILGGLLMIVFLVLVALGVIVLIRYLMGPRHHNTDSDSSLSILKERYAKGEIDKNQYEEMKKEIM